MAAPPRDCYKILGVAPLASVEDIRKAFRLLSKQYHPDINPDLQVVKSDRMQELVAAYNTLNDAERRQAYDAQPHLQLRRKKAAGDHRKVSVQGVQRARYERQAPPPSVLQKLTSLFSRPATAGGSARATPALDPKQSDTHMTLGLTLAGKDGLYEQARAEFKLALKFDSTNVEAQYNLALSCYKLGEFAEARREFERVLALDRHDRAAQTMLALLQDDDR